MKNFKGIIALMAIFVLANQCMATPRRKSLTVAQQREIQQAAAARRDLIGQLPQNTIPSPQAVQEFQRQEQVLQYYQNIPAAQPMISQANNELSKTHKASLAAMQNAAMILQPGQQNINYANFMKSFRGQIILPNNTINPQWFSGAMDATRKDLGSSANAQSVPKALWLNVINTVNEYSQAPTNRNNKNFYNEIKSSFDEQTNIFRGRPNYANFLKTFTGPTLINDTINPEWFAGAAEATRKDLGSVANAQNVPATLWGEIMEIVKEDAQLPAN